MGAGDVTTCWEPPERVGYGDLWTPEVAGGKPTTGGMLRVVWYWLGVGPDALGYRG